MCIYIYICMPPAGLQELMEVVFDRKSELTQMQDMYVYVYIYIHTYTYIGYRYRYRYTCRRSWTRSTAFARSRPPHDEQACALFRRVPLCMKSCMALLAYVNRESDPLQWATREREKNKVERLQDWAPRLDRSWT